MSKNLTTSDNVRQKIFYGELSGKVFICCGLMIRNMPDHENDFVNNNIHIINILNL